MSALRINGQYVLIRDVAKNDFASFVNLCVQRLGPDGSIPHVAASVVATLLAEGKPQTDPVVQAGFEICSNLGVRNFWTDGANANVTEEVPTDAAAGLETAFGFAAIESGLALAAAMCNAFRRVIRVNETEHKVLRQPREIMELIARQAGGMKNVNEPIFVTAGRLLGIKMKEGKGFDHPEVLATLCMLSDFGATAVQIDLEKGVLGFGPFSTANAMASAILQGLDAEKVKGVRDSVVKVNDGFRRVVEQQAAKNAGSQQKLTVPGVMGTRRRR
jgi:hypothetical protein